jgi:hypothetical protein
MGVCLSRLLWVRYADRNRKKRLEQGFKAADLLIQNGGFDVIALDLGGIEESLIRKVPLSTWFALRASRSALLVLLTHSAAQSRAALTPQLGQAGPQCSGAAGLSHAQIVANVQFNIEIGKARTKKASRRRTYEIHSTSAVGVSHVCMYSCSRFCSSGVIN